VTRVEGVDLFGAQDEDIEPVDDADSGLGQEEYARMQGLLNQ
jgi:hypothetical protein